MQQAMTNDMPIHGLSSFSGGQVTRSMLADVVEKLNGLIGK